MSAKTYLAKGMPNTLLMNAVKQDSSLDAVLIDLDSCLLDFFGVFLPKLNAFTGENLTEQDFHSFNIDEVADISYQDVMHLLNTSDYMLNMSPFARTLEFLQACRAKGLRVVLSTSRVFDPICYTHTFENLKQLGFDYEELHLVSGNKWETKSDPNIRYVLYFDDSPTHLQNYFDAKDRGEEVPLMICAPKIPYNERFHTERSDLKYLDLRDYSINFESLIPQC